MEKQGFETESSNEPLLTSTDLAGIGSLSFHILPCSYILSLLLTLKVECKESFDHLPQTCDQCRITSKLFPGRQHSVAAL